MYHNLKQVTTITKNIYHVTTTCYITYKYTKYIACYNNKKCNILYEQDKKNVAQPKTS